MGRLYPRKRGGDSTEGKAPSLPVYLESVFITTFNGANLIVGAFRERA